MLVRLAEPADAQAVAEVHVRSWQAGYRGLIDGDYLDGLSVQDRADSYDFAGAGPHANLTAVAVVDGIGGFVTVRALNDPPRTGELRALYVDPPLWGRGLGHALVVEAQRLLAERGCAEAVLWLLSGNARAARFYAAHGWSDDGGRDRVDSWGAPVVLLRYRRALP